MFYGIQTLRKAMGAAKAAKVLFPAVRIADEPYLGYRGVMLDVGRTFYPVEEVKRIIDLAQQKLEGSTDKSAFNQKTDTRGHFNKEIL